MALVDESTHTNTHIRPQKKQLRRNVEILVRTHTHGAMQRASRFTQNQNKVFTRLVWVCVRV